MASFDQNDASVVVIIGSGAGGGTLEAALRHANVAARFPVCGMISTYNAVDDAGVRGLQAVLNKRIAMTGFIIYDHVHKLPAYQARVAPWLPESVVVGSSEQTLASLDAHLFTPSRLPAERCAQLEAARARFAARAGTPRGRLECRHGGAMGANAFALPSGLVVITDELVALAGDDDELAGVLAHEVAHVEYRHGLRQALQGSLLTLGAALLTGDLANAGSFVAHLPVVLAGLHYSRAFEREADARAVALLRAEGRDPRALARALDRLETRDGAAGREAPPAWLSDHPDTRERIALIEAAAR